MTQESNPARDLSRELSDQQILVEQLRAIAEDDDSLAMDLIEGQTSILELIAAVDASELDDAILMSGLDLHIGKLLARRKRIERRAEMKRAVLANALDLIGKRRLETALGTISLRRLPPVAIVTDEAAIPSAYWKAQAPTLDKAALNAAARDRAKMRDEAQKIDDPEARRAALDACPADIPGTTISNQGFSLGIKR